MNYILQEENKMLKFLILESAYHIKFFDVVLIIISITFEKKSCKTVGSIKPMVLDSLVLRLTAKLLGV